MHCREGVLDLVAREADEWNCPGAIFHQWAERNAVLELNGRPAVTLRLTQSATGRVFGSR